MQTKLHNGVHTSDDAAGAAEGVVSLSAGSGLLPGRLSDGASCARKPASPPSGPGVGSGRRGRGYDRWRRGCNAAGDRRHNVGRSGLMSVLDVPRRTTPARLMAAVQSAGLHWTVRAGLNEAGLLTTVVTRTGQGGTVTFRVPDPAPRGRQLVGMWIDRNAGTRSAPGAPRPPALLLL